ncbi:MAG: hypothetical protein Q3972_00650 [Corynebacterium sp.]|nr:hypothetical protein [Corynebacterium sp.]
MDVQLNPMAFPILRGNGYIQFGTDGYVAGVLGPYGSRKLGALTALCGQLTQEALPTKQCILQLARAGFGQFLATQVIQELMDYKVLVPGFSRAVLTAGGYYPLVSRFAAEAKDCGMDVATPTTPKELVNYLRYSEDTQPYVHFYDGVLDWSTLLITMYNSVPIVPVAVLGNRIVIGPVRRNYAGPCLCCYEHYRRDADPRWDTIRHQYAGSLGTLPSHTRNLILGHTLSVVRNLMGFPPPPGGRPEEIKPGYMLQVGVDGSFVHHSRVDVHPGCNLHRPWDKDFLNVLLPVKKQRREE